MNNQDDHRIGKKREAKFEKKESPKKKRDRRPSGERTYGKKSSSSGTSAQTFQKTQLYGQQNSRSVQKNLVPPQYEKISIPVDQRNGRSRLQYGRRSPQNGRRSPQNGRRSPQNGRGSHQYGRGSHQYGRGSHQYGRGSHQYGRGSSQNGRRSHQYDNGRRSPLQYGRNNQYGSKNNQHGSRTNQYDRRPQYGRGSHQYGRGSSQNGRRSHQYDNGRRSPLQYGRNNQYGSKNNQHGSRTNQYDRRPQYGRGSPQYGRRSPQNGRRSHQYGNRNNQYGNKNNQYDRRSQYGNKNNQYDNGSSHYYRGSNLISRREMFKPTQKQKLPFEDFLKGTRVNKDENIDELMRESDFSFRKESTESTLKLEIEKQKLLNKQLELQMQSQFSHTYGNNVPYSTRINNENNNVFVPYPARINNENNNVFVPYPARVNNENNNNNNVFVPYPARVSNESNDDLDDEEDVFRHKIAQLVDKIKKKDKKEGDTVSELFMKGWKRKKTQMNVMKGKGDQFDEIRKDLEGFDDMTVEERVELSKKAALEIKRPEEETMIKEVEMYLEFVRRCGWDIVDLKYCTHKLFNYGCALRKAGRNHDTLLKKFRFIAKALSLKYGVGEYKNKYLTLNVAYRVRKIFGRGQVMKKFPLTTDIGIRCCLLIIDLKYYVLALLVVFSGVRPLAIIRTKTSYEDNVNVIKIFIEIEHGQNKMEDESEEKTQIEFVKNERGELLILKKEVDESKRRSVMSIDINNWDIYKLVDKQIISVKLFMFVCYDKGWRPRYISWRMFPSWLKQICPVYKFVVYCLKNNKIDYFDEDGIPIFKKNVSIFDVLNDSEGQKVRRTLDNHFNNSLEKVYVRVPLSCALYEVRHHTLTTSVTTDMTKSSDDKRTALVQNTVGNTKSVLHVYTKFQKERTTCVSDVLFNSEKKEEELPSIDVFKVKNVLELVNECEELSKRIYKPGDVYDTNYRNNNVRKMIEGEKQENYSGLDPQKAVSSIKILKLPKLRGYYEKIFPSTELKTLFKHDVKINESFDKTKKYRLLNQYCENVINHFDLLKVEWNQWISGNEEYEEIKKKREFALEQIGMKNTTEWKDNLKFRFMKKFLNKKFKKISNEKLMKFSIKRNYLNDKKAIKRKVKDEGYKRYSSAVYLSTQKVTLESFKYCFTFVTTLNLMKDFEFIHVSSTDRTKSLLRVTGINGLDLIGDIPLHKDINDLLEDEESSEQRKIEKNKHYLKVIERLGGCIRMSKTLKTEIENEIELCKEKMKVKMVSISSGIVLDYSEATKEEYEATLKRIHMLEGTFFWVQIEGSFKLFKYKIFSSGSAEICLPESNDKIMGTVFKFSKLKIGIENIHRRLLKQVNVLNGICNVLKKRNDIPEKYNVEVPFDEEILVYLATTDLYSFRMILALLDEINMNDDGLIFTTTICFISGFILKVIRRGGDVFFVKFLSVGRNNLINVEYWEENDDERKLLTWNEVKKNILKTGNALCTQLLSRLCFITFWKYYKIKYNVDVSGRCLVCILRSKKCNESEDIEEECCKECLKDKLKHLCQEFNIFKLRDNEDLIGVNVEKRIEYLFSIKRFNSIDNLEERIKNWNEYPKIDFERVESKSKKKKKKKKKKEKKKKKKKE